MIPAATREIKDELDIGDSTLGVLGSMVYLGLLVGSLLSGYLFTSYPSKQVIVLSFGMVVVSLVGFTFSGKVHFLLSVSRVLCGFFQVILA